jgi:hypothetical protein
MEASIILGGITIIAGIFFISNYYSDLSIIKRKLKHTPLQKIAYFKEGSVGKIVGKVKMIDTSITAPLSGRDCAYYHVTVEQKINSGKSTYWRKVIDEDQMCKFIIDDGSGSYAYFDSEYLQKHIVKDRNYTTGFWHKKNDKLIQYLIDHQINPLNWIKTEKTFRYQEGILETNETIAIIAKGLWKKAEELELPSSYYRILNLIPTESEAIYISDDPDTTKIEQEDTFGNLNI